MMTDGFIILRPFEPRDASSAYEGVRESLPAISQWMPDLHEGLTEQNVRSWIDATPRLRSDGVIYHFAITGAADGKFLGGCSVNHIDAHHRFANLTYWVRGAARGRGVAPAAVRLMARFAFEKLGMQRAEIVIVVGNTASRRVAEKAGAQLEGTLRNRIHLHGVAHDAFMFSLLPADLPPPAADRSKRAATTQR